MLRRYEGELQKVHCEVVEKCMALETGPGYRLVKMYFGEFKGKTVDRQKVVMEMIKMMRELRVDVRTEQGLDVDE